MESENSLTNSSTEAFAETLTMREDETWNAIVTHFREACLSFHEGHEDDARRLASEVLPPLIREWSSLCDQPTEVKKERLLALFCSESRKISDLGMLQRLIVTRLSERVLPAYAGQLKGLSNPPQAVPQGSGSGLAHAPSPSSGAGSPPTMPNQEATRLVLQKAARRNPALQRKIAAASASRKVPINDIAGMIDALHAAEFAGDASEIVPLRELFDSERPTTFTPSRQSL